MWSANTVLKIITGRGTIKPFSSMILKKGLRFNNTWDVILLKSAVFGETHIARHGECKNRFDNVLERFIFQLSNEVWECITKTTWKSLNDWYKKVVTDHRVPRRANKMASGIIDIRGVREERTTMAQRVKQAGEKIRKRAAGGLVVTDESEIITPPSSKNQLLDLRQDGVCFIQKSKTKNCLMNTKRGCLIMSLKDLKMKRK